MFFELKLKASSAANLGAIGLAPLPLSKLWNHLEVIKQTVDSKGESLIYKSRKTEAETLYLSDIKVEVDSVSLLINLSDKDASNSVYSDPSKKSSRTLAKVGDEGNDYSSHVVISSKPNSNGTYLTLIEVSPGLSSKRITMVLNYFFRLCVSLNKEEYKVLHPDGSFDKTGNPVSIVAHHKCSLHGHPSQDFLNDLNGGILEGIELIDSRKSGQLWDQNGFTKEVARSVMIKPVVQKSASNWTRATDALGMGATQNYQTAKIKFKTEKGMPKTVTLETETLDFATDALYIKKELIDGFNAPLEASSQKIHPEIVSKMHYYLK